MFRAVGVDQAKLQFVRGSKYQRTPEFFDDLLRLSKKVSMDDAEKASSEIVKSTGNTKMADGRYPLMRNLEVLYWRKKQCARRTSRLGLTF